MLNTFTLDDLFERTWGYRPLNVKFDDPTGGSNIRAVQQGNFSFQNSSLVNQKSKTGKYGEYYKNDGMGKMVFMPVTLGGLLLPYSWISISGSKRFVETPLTERRGEVTEIIAVEDYKIVVKGFVIGQDGTFPEKMIEDLKTLFERNESVEMKCILSDIFLLSKEHGGQDKVLIKSLDIPDNPGIEHVRSYAMELKTDQIFELEFVS